MTDRVTIGTVDELQARGCLTGKAGAQPICVFWSDGDAYALDDRCPHMGFPLHRGTVESGLVTCHWHNARFDLRSGGTLDPWADDVRAYPVEIDDDRVTVVVEPEPDRTAYLTHRLEEGLEQGITLVIAKAVLGLLDAGVPAGEIVRTGVEFGTRYRQAGWGAGLTVLTAMANVLPSLDEGDHALALVHGLAFVSRDTRGRPPRFPLLPLDGGSVPSRSSRRGTGGSSRRGRATRPSAHSRRPSRRATRPPSREVMFAAVTDHVFVDGGHTIDFTNKAFEVLDHLGWDAAPEVLPTLVAQTAAASRCEEQGSWRYPVDLTAMLRAATAALARPSRRGRAPRHVRPRPAASPCSRGRSWPRIPPRSSARSTAAIAGGATPEELARAVAYAAALRITRFHTQNDHGDWDEVHHAFTAANALHQAVTRVADPRTAPRRLPRRAARLPRPLPQHPGRAAPRAAGVGRGCRPRRPAGVLGPGRPRRRSRNHRVPLPARRR